jgi:hypothetical protein
MALSDTLRQIHERQEREEEIGQDAPKAREEWKSAVRDLLTQIRGYLAEYEAQRFLSYSEQTITLTEDLLGKYEVASLNIHIGRVRILVQPVGAMVTGAFGRVDMHRRGRASDQDRVILLRRKTQEGFRWDISIPLSSNPLAAGIMQLQTVFGQQSARQFEILSKDSLERAIDRLLK